MSSKVVQPEGNYYDKYHSENAIVKWMMKGFFNSISECLKKMERSVVKILEAGCGEGEVTYFLKNAYPQADIEAFDISAKVIKEAEMKKTGIRFYVGDIYTMQVYSPLENDVESPKILGGGYDLVVCSEVLEHLEEPVKALEKLHEMSDQYVLISVPREPIWRVLNMARGKYWKQFGNTPGHIQHWGTKAICRLLEENHFKIVKVCTPLPWTMVLAMKE